MQSYSATVCVEGVDGDRKRFVWRRETADRDARRVNAVNCVDLDGHRVIEGESAGIPACLISAIYCGDGPVQPTNDLDYALGAVAGGAVVARMLPKVLSRTAKALCSVLCKAPVKSVARTEPRTLFEKLVLDEAKGGAGRRIMQGRINDRRYPEDVWAKMQHRRVAYRGQAVVIHYWKNLQRAQRRGSSSSDGC